jgi:hypothetical protein
MNKLAIITGFLGAVKNRYMVYKDNSVTQLISATLLS